MAKLYQLIIPVGFPKLWYKTNLAMSNIGDVPKGTEDSVYLLVLNVYCFGVYKLYMQF